MYCILVALYAFEFLAYNIEQIDCAFALLDNLLRLRDKILVQELQLLTLLLIRNGPVLELIELIAKTLAVLVEVRENVVQFLYLLRVRLEHGAEKDIQVVQGRGRLLYASHLVISLLGEVVLLRLQAIPVLLLYEHVGPAGDWQQDPKIARLLILFVLCLDVAQLQLQFVVFDFVFFVAAGDLLVRCLYHLLAKIRLRQQRRVQLIAHIVRQHKNLGLIADLHDLCLHRLDIIAVVLDVPREEVLAILEQRLAKRRDQLIVDSSLFADLVADVVEIGLAEDLELAVLHLEEVADAVVDATVGR